MASYMPPKLKSVHVGGFSPANKKRLEAVVLPDKIYCKQCERPKTTRRDISFSNKQLDDFKNGIATRQIKPEDQAKPVWITCRKCNGQQVHELLCCICEYWKALDGFTKVQRKTPDAARCIECVYKINTEVPVGGSVTDAAIRGLDDSDDSSEGETNPFEGRSTVGESDARVPVSGSSTHPLNDENLNAVSAHNGGTNTPKLSAASDAGSWVNFARKGAPAGKEYTAYDSQGNAHTRVHSPSVADTEESFATTRVTQVKYKEMRNLTSRFAKNLGPRVECPPPPAEYVGGRPVEEDSGSSTDGSYGLL